MLKIYIASPYTEGDTAVNVRRQIDMAEALMRLGYAPYAPLMCHFQHLVHPHVGRHWLDLDLHWVEVCDAVLRLEGNSRGADEEVAWAGVRGIPVYYNLDELYLAFPPGGVYASKVEG
jgi:hypothetical protein